jgi:hypothetical protein
LVDRYPDVLCDLPQQYRRNIAALMNGYGGAPAVRMPELLVRATLSSLCKTQAFQNGNYLAI